LVAANTIFTKVNIAENKAVFASEQIQGSVGTMVAMSLRRRNDFDLTAARMQSLSKITERSIPPRVVRLEV
jgi:hypothetical protein